MILIFAVSIVLLFIVFAPVTGDLWPNLAAILGLLFGTCAAVCFCAITLHRCEKLLRILLSVAVRILEELRKRK